MYKTKLCLGVSKSYEIKVEEQIQLFKTIGFDGFFMLWESGLEKYRILADRLGMIFQSIHAPFANSAKMWQNGSEAESAIDELLQCVRDAAEVQVPIVVMHTYIGFEPSEGPTESGIENYRKVVEEAAKLNVKIAFENTEGLEYLAALMDAFKTYDNVGFCWDTGHELCYSKGEDMMALYGDRLFATHLNDNLGVSDPEGKIFWTDDLHLIPFDGITNWNSVADRLNKCGYNGELTFELTRYSKPNRYDNNKYKRMEIEEYIAECYARACRVAYLKNRI